MRPLPALHHAASEDDARAHLAIRERAHHERADELDRRSRWLARGRVVAAGMVLVGVAIAINGRGAAQLRTWAPLAVAAALVGALVVRHVAVEQARGRALALAAVCREAQARLARRWRELTVPLSVESPTPTPTSSDLDLSGPASLLQLLGPAATVGGQRRLESWMLSPGFDPAAIRARHTAVRELTPAIGLREAFLAAGRLLPDDARRLETFMRWLSVAEPAWLRWAPVAVWGLTLSWWSGLAVLLLGWGDSGFWLLPLFIGWIATMALARHVHPSFAGAGALAHGLGSLITLLRLIEGLPSTDPLLAATRALVAGPNGTASRHLEHLERLVGWSRLRHGALLHVIFHSLTWWDLHVWLALVRWRQRHGDLVPRWLDAVATDDALVQLSGLAYLHPTWPFPEFSDGETRLEGRGVGHPLLPSTVRVHNDVDVGPPGTVLVITGSNMAGKSTLLRAVGLNVVLARLGAPVCATTFSLPPLRLETCMRTVDSLEHGVSSFMAQLVRLKAIVDAAAESGPPLLYLLDEVLHGTNSEERRIAVQRIVGHLLRSPAIGGLTTHDLALTQIPALAHAARHVHFAETFDDSTQPPTMHFDYVMHPGPATSRNALKLVQMMGLPEV